jgi:predicted DsbA family dithiol-disulfide isomerase
MHIDIVFDVACPWCYIGKRRLELALLQRPGLTVTRAWRPYQLNPEMPAAGASRALYLSARFGGPREAARNCAAIAAAGRGVGIQFAFDRIGRVPNTLRAHRLIRLAAAKGVADVIVEVLFAAYFRDGLDIGDGDVLAEIAGRAGLEPDEVRGFLAGEEGVEAVGAEERRTRRLGIHAVPCFILERGYAISGAQEPEIFLPLFDIAAGLGNAPAMPA